MALEATIVGQLDLTGMTSEDIVRKKFTTTTAPTAVTKQRRTIASADTAEALDLGDIATCELVMLIAITNDLQVDCDYVSSFDADIEVQEGEFAIFKPVGTVYVKNKTAAESIVYEYIALGTT